MPVNLVKLSVFRTFFFRNPWFKKKHFFSLISKYVCVSVWIYIYLSLLALWELVITGDIKGKYECWRERCKYKQKKREIFCDFLQKAKCDYLFVLGYVHACVGVRVLTFMLRAGDGSSSSADKVYIIVAVGCFLLLCVAIIVVFLLRRARHKAGNCLPHIVYMYDSGLASLTHTHALRILCLQQM